MAKRQAPSIDSASVDVDFAIDGRIVVIPPTINRVNVDRVAVVRFITNRGAGDMQVVAGNGLDIDDLIIIDGDAVVVEEVSLDDSKILEDYFLFTAG
ncbi:hypothetical protein NDU88_001940 [Pleurodeles waltl]|uniref:Uncharacterized protein n=1 Tax=Pleurodeles waltl TaxID=8319 RepID=A0AAV7RBB7_PLEWA|nr:hypothetical protein NDU88_001940 [Pleurodeles waltl]